MSAGIFVRSREVPSVITGIGLRCVLVAGLIAGLVPCTVSGQLLEPSAQSSAPNPLTDTTVKPGKVLLYELEARFAKDVAERGGAAFADWFAGDGVALGNGAAPKIGKVAIAKSATWSPKDYQLTWTPTDAMMGPSGDMGYTWGHYEGRSKDSHGNPVLTSGRYITMWRKEPDGNWKVVLDAGSNEPAGAGDCCKLPTAN
jgi:ketosteroid isomerase-like protein